MIFINIFFLAETSGIITIFVDDLISESNSSQPSTPFDGQTISDDASPPHSDTISDSGCKVDKSSKTDGSSQDMHPRPR